MTDMKALQVTSHGPPGEVLAVRIIERPDPGPGEVRVKVGAASLNFNDIDRCRGKLVSVPTPPPFTLGMDVCGVVDQVGAGAESWLGRRVVAITKTALGGIAEYALAETTSVFDAPDGFDDAEATAFLLTFQASHLALFRRGRLRAGETLVVVRLDRLARSIAADGYLILGAAETVVGLTESFKTVPDKRGLYTPNLNAPGFFAAAKPAPRLVVINGRR